MRIGIVGAGAIVKTFFRTIEMIDGCKVVSICVQEHETEKAKEFAKEYKFEKIYHSFEKFLDNKEMDFVYLAIPNSMHFSYAMTALNEGFHVIIEKPICLHKIELEKLFNVAEEKNKFFFEAITTLHFPLINMLKEKLKEIGNVKIVQCNFSKFSTRYINLCKGEMVNIFNPSMGGGGLMDINYYNIHFVQSIFGKPKEVKYYSNKKMDADTSGIVMMSYDDFQCCCIGAKDCYGDSSISIQGDKGYLQLVGTANLCKELRMKIMENDSEVIYYPYTETHMYYEMLDFKRIYEENRRNEFYKFYNMSLDAIETLEKARES